MREISHKKSYVKDVLKLAAQGVGLDELDVAINKLRTGEKLDAKYKDHQLQGKLKKYREFHLKGDLLVLYTITQTHITLYAIDNHNNLFKRFS